MPNAAIKFQPVPATVETSSTRERDRENSSAERVSEQQPSGLSASLKLFAMSLGYGVVQLDVTIVNTALDRIGTSLGGGVSELQWVVNAYTIGFAAFILTAGGGGGAAGAPTGFPVGGAGFSSSFLL